MCAASYMNLNWTYTSTALKAIMLILGEVLDKLLKNRKTYIAAKLYLIIWNGTFRITAILHFYLKHLETYPLTSKTLWFVI